MRAFWERHKALLGYLFIVAVAILAVELHHRIVAQDLNERDAISCEQRNQLARNQQLVLHTLALVVQLEDSEGEHSAFEEAVLHRSLERLRVALATSGPRPC